MSYQNLPKTCQNKLKRVLAAEFFLRGCQNSKTPFQIQNRRRPNDRAEKGERDD